MKIKVENIKPSVVQTLINEAVALYKEEGLTPKQVHNKLKSARWAVKRGHSVEKIKEALK